MNITRLANYLSHFDPSEPLLLGEKYGYGLSQVYGYDYVTGGGGMVLSREGLRQLVVSGESSWDMLVCVELGLGCMNAS